MPRSTPLLAFAVLSLAAAADAQLRTSATSQSGATALDRYVVEPDDAYRWELVRTTERDGYTEAVIDLTSQSWRDEGEVDRNVWRHWLVAVVPHERASDIALLMIGGGKNGGRAPSRAGDRLREIALATQSVVAELRTVPNQPLVFNGDGEERVEDNILAYTWDRYLETGDPTWIGQLPMAKSVVRAMDTLQQAAREHNLTPGAERFVVAGGSKRGWTTWLAAAVDPRVVAIAPIVIDVLNVVPSMDNHLAAYGDWAPALDDYVRFDLPDKRDDPAYRRLLSIVDPYVYRDRFTMPKCVINAAGDEFFTPDSSRFYFDDLPGEKMLGYFPNAGHSLEGSKALETLAAFHWTVVHDAPRPAVSWTATAANTWAISCDVTPVRAVRWRAENPDARDFRISTIGKAYRSEPLTPNADGRVLVTTEAPSKGWAATFVQLEFDVGAPAPLRLSTPVWVTGGR